MMTRCDGLEDLLGFEITVQGELAHRQRPSQERYARLRAA